jgi:MoaA/NifB/PqqE/SkfB family radical SAM enzyme
MPSAVAPLDCYRLPWSLNDNILGWLEPTKRCNLYCEGCYSRNEKGSDKTLAQIKDELDVFVKNRRMDSISIAGGDPLVHPEVVEIVRMVRHQFGLKPVLNTNGLALTPELLRELKKAGLFGFTFHVDSSQTRPGWKGADELALNELRLQFAQMVADEGDLTVSFNATIFEHTLQHVPKLLEWAARHIDLVNIMVLILFRTTRTSQFDYFAQGKPIDPAKFVYYDEDKNPHPLDAHRVVETIQAADPLFKPAAYLGGTRDPESFKWLLAGRVGDKDGIHGYVGPRFMELAQTAHHLFKGTYLAYSERKALGLGLPMMLGGSLIDGGLRDAASRFASRALASPRRLLKRQYFQAVTIIQPIDVMADGEANMCDGCPDMTVHEGKLAWSCRLDELKQFGCFLNPVPRCKATLPVVTAPPVVAPGA